MTKAFKKFHLVPASSAEVANDIHTFRKKNPHKKAPRRKKAVSRKKNPSKKVVQKKMVKKPFTWSSY